MVLATRTPAGSPASHTLFAAATGALLACLVSGHGCAAGASPWDGDGRSAVRLVAGGSAGPSLRAAVEVRLGAGWKTYWRYPGDSGVPPAFDFSKSENVKSVSVLWPAPHRFDYDGGASIGYKGEVMFPLHVVLDDPARPAALRLVLDYAVCEKLCVPARGETVLAVPPAANDAGANDARANEARANDTRANDTRLAAAEALTPKPVEIGQAVGTLGIAAVRLEPGAPHPRVVVDVAAPAGAPLDLFAEGPTPDWALPLPARVPGAASGHQRFVFDLDGAPPGIDGTGAPLRFTLVSGENAVEATAVPK